MEYYSVMGKKDLLLFVITWIDLEGIMLSEIRQIEKDKYEGRSQDGGGIGRVITFSSTNSLKEQQNGEQSLQNNFWSLAADIRRPEKQPIVFEGR